MDEQLWFAGLPVLGTRRLGESDDERFDELVARIRNESLLSYLILMVGTVVVVAGHAVNINADWTGLIIFALACVALGYVPQRRFFSPRRLLRLRRDMAEPGSSTLCCP